MDQSAEVPCAEVVSVVGKDLYEFMSFERFHGHAVLHSTPCRHFAGRLTDLQFSYAAFVRASEHMITITGKEFKHVPSVTFVPE